MSDSITRKPAGHELVCGSLKKLIYLIMDKYRDNPAAQHFILQSWGTLVEQLAAMHIPKKARAEAARVVAKTADIVQNHGLRTFNITALLEKLPQIIEAIKFNKSYDPFAD